RCDGNVYKALIARLPVPSADGTRLLAGIGSATLAVDTFACERGFRLYAEVARSHPRSKNRPPPARKTSSLPGFVRICHAAPTLGATFAAEACHSSLPLGSVTGAGGSPAI